MVVNLELWSEQIDDGRTKREDGWSLENSKNPLRHCLKNIQYTLIASKTNHAEMQVPSVLLSLVVQHLPRFVSPRAAARKSGRIFPIPGSATRELKILLLALKYKFLHLFHNRTSLQYRMLCSSLSVILFLISHREKKKINK